METDGKVTADAISFLYVCVLDSHQNGMHVKISVFLALTYADLLTSLAPVG